VKSYTYYGASGGEYRPHRRGDGTAGTAGSPREARRRRGGGGGRAAPSRPKKGPHTPWVGAAPATRKATPTTVPRAGKTRPRRRRDGTPGTAGSPREPRRRRGAGGGGAAAPRLKKVRTRLRSAADQPRGTTCLARRGAPAAGCRRTPQPAPKHTGMVVVATALATA